MNNEKTQKPVSRLYLVEKGTWKNDQEVITFYYKDEQNKPKAVGHVYVHYDENSKAVFHSQDAKGNELFPPCDNRFQLKKQFLDNEQELIQKYEQQQEFQKNPVPENGQQINTDQQVQPPVNNTPPPPQKPAKEKTSRRKNELKEIRLEKGDTEKEQTISH